jgi:hypothetical protein
MDRVMGSKALAAEVRILLQEVGKLRDEKRALQYEVADLLATKASNYLQAVLVISDFYHRLDMAQRGTISLIGMWAFIS